MGAPAKVVKRTPAKKAAARKAEPQMPKELMGFYDQGAEISDDDLDLVTPAEGEEDEVPTEKLFSIDGKEYRIPVEFGPHHALVFIDAASRGADEWAAVGRVLRTVMGEEAWKALVGFKHLQTHQLKAILNKAMVKVMGAMEEAAKNS